MKKRFDGIEIGEHFKYYNKIYRKYNYHDAAQIVGKVGGDYYSRFFIGEDNVIPVTVTIKVKEN